MYTWEQLFPNKKLKKKIRWQKEERGERRKWNQLTLS